MRRMAVWTATHGRDAGKQFKITEMSADAAERWAIRLLLALANAGAKLPDGLLDSGMAGIAVGWPQLLVQGIRSLAGLEYKDAEPLLHEMMSCVQFVPPGMNGMVVALLPGEGSQVEEVHTRLQLRYEVLQVHVGFSLADALRNSTPSPAPQSA